MKKVFKYGTGQEIPEGAVYLSTIKQEETEIPNAMGGKSLIPCWLVWHYFLVEVKDSKE